MAAFFNNVDCVGPLLPREGLWGGHTEVYCCSYTVDLTKEIMEYIDVYVQYYVYSIMCTSHVPIIQCVSLSYNQYGGTVPRWPTDHNIRHATQLNKSDVGRAAQSTNSST